MLESQETISESEILNAAIEVLPEEHKQNGLAELMSRMMFSGGIFGFELGRAQEVLTGPGLPWVVGIGLFLLAHFGARETKLKSDVWLYYVPLIGGIIGGVAVNAFRDPSIRNQILSMIF